MDLKYNDIYYYFISFETIVKEISIATALICGHFNSHYDELILTRQGMSVCGGGCGGSRGRGKKEPVPVVWNSQSLSPAGKNRHINK